jgi:hypothetical protein
MDLREYTETDTYQIMSDGKSVWINSANGMCIGRYTLTGVDIHQDAAAQIATGRECLDCFDRTADPDFDWLKFTEGMKFHYNIDVPEIHKPVVKGLTNDHTRSNSHPRSCTL